MSSHVYNLATYTVARIVLLLCPYYNTLIVPIHLVKRLGVIANKPMQYLTKSVYYKIIVWNIYIRYLHSQKIYIYLFLIY